MNYTILAVSDVEILRNYSLEILKKKFLNIDIILSAGDVSYDYLDYLISILDKDLFYINGNHTYGEQSSEMYSRCIDSKYIKYKNLKILGLEGSKLYSYNKYQYTEFQMALKILKNLPFLLIDKPDIILTHSPPQGIHDLNDIAHKGFKVFLPVIKYLSPKLWIHGHTHLNNHLETQESIIYNTRVINVYGYKIINLKL